MFFLQTKLNAEQAMYYVKTLYKAKRLTSDERQKHHDI